MVVRLKDLDKDKENQRGLVRIKDILPPEPPKPSMSTAIETGSAPSLNVRNSPLLQQVEETTPPPEPQKPALYRIQKAIYDKTLGPATDAAMRVAANVVDPFRLGRGIAEREGVDLRANPIFQGMSAPETTAEKITDFAGQAAGTILPGMAAYKTGGKLAGNLVARNLPNAPRLAQKAARGIGAATTFGTTREALEALTGDRQSLAGRLGDIGIDAAIGGAADIAVTAAAPYIKKGITRLRDLVRGTPEPGPTLALPEPRQRGNINRSETPDIINVPETEPRGLPEPQLAEPTRARLERIQRENPYRQQLDDFFASAREMGVPPESLRGIWANTAGPNDPKTLDELIDLAYPPSRVTPDLVSRARQYQASREVAGAPMPVRSLSDRYPQGGVTGTVSTPLTKVARVGSPRSVQPDVEIVEPQRRFPTAPQTQQVTPPVSAQVSQARQRTPNERGLFGNLRESGKLTDEVQEALDASSKRTYKPITNADTVAAANRRVAKDINAAEAYALSGTRVMSAEQVATGFRLIDEFQKSGEVERAVTVAEKLAERLTKAGQSIQAASIWNRLTPEGALVAAQRIVNRVNETLPKTAKNISIDAKTADSIKNAAQAIQSAGESHTQAGNVLDILDRMKRGETVTDSERQSILDFVRDAKQYMKPEKQPRPAKPPKEMNEPRIRDKVVTFFDEKEQAALERIRARKNRLSSTPFDEWADYAIVGASKLAKGTVKFSDWSAQMIQEFGEAIRPQLANIYNRAQELVSTNAKRISGETISQAERIAENYVKRHESTIKPEDTQLIRGLAQKVSELSGSAKTVASQDLQALLNGFERAGVGRKLASTQYISMLLNPVTQVRNILGNEMLYRIERLSRIAATPIDWTYSKITGKDRQITFAKGGWEKFLAPTTDYWKGWYIGTKAGWRGVNPEGLTTAYDISGQAFRSKLNPLTYLEKTLGAVMKGFDYAAFNRASNQRIREMAYLDAVNRGIKGKDAIRAHMEKYAANLDDNIAAIAKEYGRYVTLQDDTALSRALNSFKRGTNKLTTGSKDFGLGSIILPFAKTPANLLMRAIDYSPLGFAKAIFQANQVLRSRTTDLTRADVIQSVTRALFGSGLTGVGLWLAHKGILRGESPADRDVRELERQSGLSQYQLNGSALQRVLGAMVTGNLADVDKAAKMQSGDTLWQYEWAQPMSIPLALGANVVQERRQAERASMKNENPEGALKSSIDVTTGALNTLLNTSVLQGLQQAFDLPPGEENKVKAIATNVIKQVPGMFVPSMVNRINQSLDPTVRETYSPNFVEQVFNPSQSRIPGLAQQLPQRVNTLGAPQTRPNSFFDAFLTPSQRAQFKPTAEAKFVMDLLAETGDERVAPRAVPRYITGIDPLSKQNKRIELTGEQLTKYQTIVGQETAKRLGRISPNASTEAKVKAVLKALNDAGEVGRKQMKKELGLK